MSTRWQTEATTIGRLRVRLPADGSGMAQHRVGAVLRNAQLRPTRLSSSAILCLQKFRDPAPGLRWASYHRTHPPPEWEESATRELDRLVMQAVRPALTVVPTSAEAVLFADRAEMLACLAFDWLRGTLRTNWWWMTLVHGEDGEAVLAREWLGSPEFIPLALDYLAGSRLIAFITQIRAEFASALLSRVLHVFAVPEAKTTGSGLDQQVETVSKEKKLHPERLMASSPWSLIVPEADAPQLTPLKRVLVAQALMLRRAAATARTTAFQTAVADWQQAQVFVLRGEQQTRAAKTLVLPHPATADARILRTDIEPALPASSSNNLPIEANDFEQSPRGTLSLAKPLPSETLRINQVSVGNQPKGQKVQSRFIESKSVRAEQSDTEVHVALSCAVVPPQEMQHSDVGKSVLVPKHEIAIANAVSDEPLTNSGFAGAFFLINVALALGLYSDFTSPRGQNLELDLWDFLCLLTAQFLDEELGDDRLNDVLANLAGRPEMELPGANFHPPQDWQIPSSWLAPFPEFFEWKEVVSENRAQVWHPAGFLLKDKAREHARDTRTDLKRWIEWIASYVRARLARATGRDDAEKLVCHVAGDIAVTAMRVDVYYSLTSYPTEIRLAGLDRDPGWVPAAGRYVAYHFD